MQTSSSSSNQKKYTSINPVKRFLISRFLTKIFLKIKKISPSLILDVGCGEGQADKFFLERSPSLKIIGIDINSEALKIAKDNCPQMKIKKGNIYHLPFLSDSFDLVLCLEVLEHLKKPKKALKEIKRVGRRFIISVPYEPYFSLLSFLSGKYLKAFGRHPEHIQTWNKKTFVAFMKKEFPAAKIRVCFPWLIAEGGR